MLMVHHTQFKRKVKNWSVYAPGKNKQDHIKSY